MPGDPYRTLYDLAVAPDALLRQTIERGRAARAACIFCRIVRGAAEAGIVHRDPFTLAFMNLRQANAGHVLVIPRRHVETVYELDDALAARVAQTVVRVSRGVRAAMNAEGLSIWQSNGEAAFQEVPHVHVHLFPRRKGDGYLRVYPSHPAPQSPAVLEALAAKIRAAL
ncbi:MAG: HIT family protein [Caldilineae bacterium]|nr:MAG: HIT family protein [Caldilineae bacterium]